MEINNTEENPGLNDALFALCAAFLETKEIPWKAGAATHSYVDKYNGVVVKAYPYVTLGVFGEHPEGTPIPAAKNLVHGVGEFLKGFENYIGDGPPQPLLVVWRAFPAVHIDPDTGFVKIRARLVKIL